jgi:5'-nucleotidase
VLILLTNDDGVYAPGLAAMEKELRRHAEVCLVAPHAEQSGVGHSITFLTPLVVQEVFEGERRRGWAVEGSPADSVKLGISEFCPRRPDLVVSGINGGLNAGINVLYSGTVAAAIEGAFFGITSVAVSLEFDEHAGYERAAALAWRVIEQILERKSLKTAPVGESHLYNLNIPQAALEGQPRLAVVPMSVARYGEKFERRTDPRGRNYYWATNEPRANPSGEENDITALAKGCITLTPLNYNMTYAAKLADMRNWEIALKE